MLSWKLPCRSNGNIKKFLIKCIRVDGLNEAFNYEVIVTDNQDEYSFATTDFPPDSRFNISIRAVNEDVLGKETTINIIIEAGG